MSAIIAPRLKWMQRLAHESYAPSTDVPNFTNWWRADTTTNAGGFVSSLNDKKGSVNLAQASGPKQPSLTTSDANMGGRASMGFDGVASALVAASPGIGTTNAITIYMVVRSVATPASTGTILGMGSTAVNQSIQVTVATNGNHNFTFRNPAASASGWVVSSASAGTSASSPVIISGAGVLTNGGSTVWDTRYRIGTLGAVNGSAATGAGLANQAIVLGAAPPTGVASYEAFTFAELMICNAAHTTEQMRRVELYLAGYYGLL